VRLLGDKYMDCSSNGSTRAEVTGECGQPRPARDPIEHRIEIMQGVADLVQVIGRILLDEEADRAAGLAEVPVTGMALIPGREAG
jgi:hypothetical protein